jgi:hypothetical protein
MRIDNEREAGFAHWAVCGDERRYRVLGTGIRGGRNLRVWPYKRKGAHARTCASSERLGVAGTAAGRIEARAQAAARFSGHRSADGIDFHKSIEPIQEILQLRPTQCRQRQTGANTAGAYARILGLPMERGLLGPNRCRHTGAQCNK